MDGQTDGFAIAYSALSMLSRAKNIQTIKVDTTVTTRNLLFNIISSHLASSPAVNVSLEVVSNSSLFSRMKLRCMRAICAMIRSRRFAASSIFFRFSLSSFPSTLLPRCRCLDGVVTVPSPSEFWSLPISSSDWHKYAQKKRLTCTWIIDYMPLALHINSKKLYGKFHAPLTRLPWANNYSTIAKILQWTVCNIRRSPAISNTLLTSIP